MAGDRASRQDRAGSGIEPPVAPKVRRAFGLLERLAPAAGARWALELWCTRTRTARALPHPAAPARDSGSRRFHRASSRRRGRVDPPGRPDQLITLDQLAPR